MKPVALNIALRFIHGTVQFQAVHVATFARAHTFLYSSNSQNFPFVSKISVDAKMTSIMENQTSLVKSLLYLQCTRLVQFSLIIVLFASIKLIGQQYFHVGNHQVLHKIQFKNWLTDRHLLQKM